MSNTVVIQEYSFSELLERSSKDPVKMGIMNFWARHRNDRYSLSVIYFALDFNHYRIKRALDELVEDGLLTTWNESGLCYYSLIHDERKRRILVDFINRKSE